MSEPSPPDVERAARAYYVKLTEHCAILRPGAPFKTWDELPQEQRTMQLAATRAALAAMPSITEAYEWGRREATEAAAKKCAQYAWARRRDERDPAMDRDYVMGERHAADDLATAIRASRTEEKIADTCEHDWSEWEAVLGGRGYHVERKCSKCGTEQYDD